MLRNHAMDSEIFSKLEVRLEEQETKSNSIMDRLDDMLAKINLLTILITPTLIPILPVAAPPGTPPLSTMRSRVKPAVPSSYNGDRATGRAFITSLQIYL